MVDLINTNSWLIMMKLVVANNDIDGDGGKCGGNGSSNDMLTVMVVGHNGGKILTVTMMGPMMVGPVAIASSTGQAWQ